MRNGITFDLYAIAQMVPDCGYKLRRIEVEAVGKLEDRRFIFDSNGQTAGLDEPSTMRGHGLLHGRFEAPVEESPRLQVDSFKALTAR